MQNSRFFDEEIDRDGSPIDAVDDEDTSGGSIPAKPWDPGKIRITTKSFSLRDVVDQIEDDEIDLSPDFQREYVWKARQRTRLIESILLGIPLPAFYFNQEKDGTYQVVDGVQRLSTIALFMRNEHVLDKEDLEYLHGLHGATFKTLEPAASRRLRSTQIVVHVIEPQTPDEVKYDIFGRVNTLGSPLSAQEIRHAMSKERSRSFLRTLSESESFDAATEMNYWRRDPSTGRSTRDSGRMTNRELALRFCAFRWFVIEEYRKHSSLDAFLVEFTRRLDGKSESAPPISDEGLEGLRLDFNRAMINARSVMGRLAFRRLSGNGASRRGPINRAVFESQAVALAIYEPAEIADRREQIKDAFVGLFDDLDYARAVTVATGDSRAVAKRLNAARAVLAGVMK